MAAYTKVDIADPDGWTAQVATLLERFPKEVVDYVTDPWTGVQGQPNCKYRVPNLGDIREALDARMTQLRISIERGRSLALPSPEDRAGRPTLDELKAKFGPTWGIRTMDDALRSQS